MPKSALIIEDNDRSRVLLSDMLSRRKIYNECATTIEEAAVIYNKARVQGHPFDIVVADLSLGRLTPLETLPLLKKEFSETTIRALSGAADDPDVIQACQRLGIKLIMKGEPEEEILKSILYGILESTGDREVSEMILREVPQRRELEPDNSLRRGTGFFANWSSVAKGIVATGAVLGAFSVALTLGGTLYHGLEEKVTSGEQTKEHFARIDAEQVISRGERLANSERIRKVEDATIKLEANVSNLGTKIDSNKTDIISQLNRIENKVDLRK